MKQEKSPEDEAFEELERKQSASGKLTSPSELVKEVLRPFEEAVQEMSMDAMMYGTGMMKVSMNNQGQIQAETIRYRDAFPKEYTIHDILPVSRNETLEEVALEFDKMTALGDTAASFAAFVRAMKK